MALIGKIRKNFWFVLILLGLALAAFVIMDMTSAGGQGQNATSLTIGEVDGQTLDYRAFQQTEQSYFQNNNADVFSKRRDIWNFYVEDALLRTEADKMGMSISKDELIDLQFGANPSPVISANWSNPQTGQLDIANLQQIKSNIENGEPMDPRFRAYWAEQEKQIMKEALQAKMNNLISKSIYTPNWMAEASYKLDNSKVDFKYVKIPYDQISSDGIELSDSDYKAYLQQNAGQFEKDEQTRTIDYVVFDVVPTAEDSAAIFTKLEGLNNELAATDNDSLFVTVNNGVYTHLYVDLEQLPESSREPVSQLNPGELYGPFEDNGFYLTIKLLDKKVVPDTVEARHILRATDPNNPASIQQARAFIDSIRTVYTSGAESFDSLAIKHSNDTQSGLQGGDLGKFTQDRMVPEFAKAAFIEGQEGSLMTVTTQFGVHLIEIQDQIFGEESTKYHVASIGQAITPSQETQDDRYDEITEIVAASRDIEALNTALEAYPDASVQTSNPLTINDFAIGDLGANQSSRDIIKWAFEPSTEVGDVSPEVYRYTDNVNYYDNKYVLAGLNSIIPAGLPTVEAVKGQIEVAVMNNKKGEKLASELSVSSLDEVAGQHNTTVETASDVSLNTTFIPGMGNEPKVIGAAFDLDVQAISKPIVGNSGVYVVQPISKQEAGTATNIPFLKQSLNTTTRSQVNFKIMQNLKDRAEIKDDRYKFY